MQIESFEMDSLDLGFSQSFFSPRVSRTEKTLKKSQTVHLEKPWTEQIYRKYISRTVFSTPFIMIIFYSRLWGVVPEGLWDTCIWLSDFAATIITSAA